MSILSYNHLAIFSFPRAGTKLIASILEQQGYFNHGEWYDVWSSDIRDDRAVRAPRESIRQNLQHLYKNLRLTDLGKLHQTIKRHEKLQLRPRSVITIWYENAINFPFMFSTLGQHHWICPQREIWDQLTSFVVSWHNNNFNGQLVSKPVVVDIKWFETFFWRWHHVYEIQTWLVSTGQGTLVKFQDLIQGDPVQLGFDYQVMSQDEHKCPEALILNLDEVRSTFSRLQTEVAFLGKQVVDIH